MPIRDFARAMDELHAIDHATEAIAGRILGAVREVYREMGPGLPEAVYHGALALALEDASLAYVHEPRVPPRYKGRPLREPVIPDFLVEGRIVVELKSVEEFHPTHHLQILSYLCACEVPLGFLVNFNVPRLALGIKRKVLTRPPARPTP